MHGPKDANGKPLDGVPFHPYYSVHDLLGVGGFLFVFTAVIFFMPEFGGYFLEYNNFIPADPLKTPPHIAPVWYFTPFYSILRATTEQFMIVLAVGTIALSALVLLTVRNPIARGAIAVGTLVLLLGYFTIDAKFWGVVLMGASVLIFIGLPWLDQSPAKLDALSADLALLAADRLGRRTFVVLGYFGTQPPSPAGQYIAMLGTVIYFAFFALMPWWSRMGTFKPVPDRVVFQPH